jgi:hypothetical protein
MGPKLAQPHFPDQPVGPELVFPMVPTLTCEPVRWPAGRRPARQPLGHESGGPARPLVPVHGAGAFAHQADTAGIGAAVQLLRSVDAINQHMRQRAVELARTALEGNLTGRRIAVWGAAFKAGIDDIRDSPGLDVAQWLHQAGAHVTVYDPPSHAQARKPAPALAYAPTAAEAAQDADLILITTGWPEFGALDPYAIADRPCCLIQDASACSRGVIVVAWKGSFRLMSSGHVAEPRCLVRPHLPAHRTAEFLGRQQGGGQDAVRVRRPGRGFGGGRPGLTAWRTVTFLTRRVHHRTRALTTSPS